MAENGNGNKKIKVGLMIAIVVVIMIILFVLVSLLNVPFRWAFDLIIVVLATVFIYYILKTYYYSYYYELIGDNFVVKQNIGSSERYIITVSLMHVKELVEADRINDVIKSEGIKKTDRLFDGSHCPEKGLVYIDESTGEKCLLRFTPRDAVLEKLKTAIM